MPKISIIGNGFDIRHGLNTSYDDFFKYFQTEASSKNVIFEYLLKVKKCTSWLDFEQGLLEFLEQLSIFKNSMRCHKSDYKTYYFDILTFVSSPETMVFYNTIKEMKYDFFSKNSIGNFTILEDDWQVKLIKSVEKDYNELKHFLKLFLISKTENIDIVPLTGSEIEVIKQSSKVFTFNYTKILELYNLDNYHHVHGSLEEEIILGIPFSTKMNIREFHSLFKISQSINLNKNMKIYDNLKEKIELYFIGFSFGVTDHYFFQEIKDWITKYTLNDYTKMPPIYFNFYYHKDEAKLDYLYNLRIFLGEEMLVRFDIANNIKFIKY